jgi:hypothetical protein
MNDLGDLNNWTKIDLARVIVQALFNSDKPPAADNVNVKRQARKSKDLLLQFAPRAIEALNQRAIAKL